MLVGEIEGCHFLSSVEIAEMFFFVGLHFVDYGLDFGIFFLYFVD